MERPCGEGTMDGIRVFDENAARYDRWFDEKRPSSLFLRSARLRSTAEMIALVVQAGFTPGILGRRSPEALPIRTFR